MAINWQLIGIMLGYAFFNGIGSFFYKKGLAKITDPDIKFTTFNKKNLKFFFQLLLNPIWVLGLICLGIDFVIYQFALRNYEVSVVKPLVNLNLIFVLFFGIIILHEKIKLKEWLGLVLVVVGAIFISLNAKEVSSSLNIMKFWIFTGIFLLVLVILIIGIHLSSKFYFEFFGSIICGILYGMGSVYNKILFSINSSNFYKIIGLILFLSTYLGAFLYGQTAYLKGRMSIVSSLVNVMSIITPFIGGILLFNENFLLPNNNGFWRFSKLIGTITILIGIVLNVNLQAQNQNFHKEPEVTKLNA